MRSDPSSVNWLKLTIAASVLTALGWAVTAAPVALSGGPLTETTAEAPMGGPNLYLPKIMRDYAGPSQWPQLAADPQRTAYVSTNILTPWRVRWIWNGPAGGGDGGAAAGHLRLPKNVQPVVGAGHLYIGHDNGFVYAIRTTTGLPAWSTDLGSAIVNTAAVDEATSSVYVGTLNGRLYRLNAATGQSLGFFNVGGEVRMAPLLVGGRVYIGSTNGNFYALDRSTLAQQWVYAAGAPLKGSAAYSTSQGGLIILLAEDKSVHAVRVSNGTQFWRRVVNADADALRENAVFADTFPVVSEINGLVIVRSYLDWSKIWSHSGGAPSNQNTTRTYLTQNPTYQSFHVLRLSDGQPAYVAPVLLGGIANGGDMESMPPQAVVKRLPDGSEIAYVLWRNQQSCINSFCDSREDTTLGEMNLTDGSIRFVRDWGKVGNMRFPSDEQSPLSMAGDILFHSHWMLLGSVRITDRSPGLGGSYSNPIQTQKMTPVLNTLRTGGCGARSGHYCPTNMLSPCDAYGVDPGFYVYYHNQCVYDQFWTTIVRSAVISNGAVYWRSNDGAITAVGP